MAGLGRHPVQEIGLGQPAAVFRKMLRDMIETDHLPDYSLTEEPGDILCVTRRAVVVLPGEGPLLREATLTAARALRPGWDVHALVAEWQGLWARSGRPRLRSADAAFLGWLRKRGQG